MSIKGSLIFWEIPDKLILPIGRVSEGMFGNIVPRNDLRAAMVKALKDFTKGNDKLYRRFNDGDGFASFTVFVQEQADADLNLKKEVTFRLDKRTGVCDLIKGECVPENLLELFRQHTTTMDGDQLRQTVLRYVKRNCVGVAMRQSGGIYFVDQRFQENLNGLYNALGEINELTDHKVKVHTVSVHSDDNTMEAIESAAAQELQSEIDTMVRSLAARYDKGDLTKKQLETQVEAVNTIMEKARVHRDNLRKSYSIVEGSIRAVEQALENGISKIEAGLELEANFLSELTKA